MRLSCLVLSHLLVTSKWEGEACSWAFNDFLIRTFVWRDDWRFKQKRSRSNSHQVPRDNHDLTFADWIQRWFSIIYWWQITYWPQLTGKGWRFQQQNFDHPSWVNERPTTVGFRCHFILKQRSKKECTLWRGLVNIYGSKTYLQALIADFSVSDFTFMGLLAVLFCTWQTATNRFFYSTTVM